MGIIEELAAGPRARVSKPTRPRSAAEGMALEAVWQRRPVGGGQTASKARAGTARTTDARKLLQVAPPAAACRGWRNSIRGLAPGRPSTGVEDKEAAHGRNANVDGFFVWNGVP